MRKAPASSNYSEACARRGLFCGRHIHDPTQSSPTQTAGKRLSSCETRMMSHCPLPIPGDESNTEFQSDQHTRNQRTLLSQHGLVGDQLFAGEVVRTASGYLASSFPKIGIGTDRKAGTTLQRIDQWLLHNSLEEAQSRGDDFKALQFKTSLSTSQWADKDAAEEYLFGHHPAVMPSPLRLLGTPLVPRPA
jgi:hypothetical protein